LRLHLLPYQQEITPFREPRVGSQPRRERVERNIYRRVGASGKAVFEVGYRDSGGKQRWQTVEGGITAARAARDDVLGRKGRGEQVRPNPGLRFGEAADAWLAGQVASCAPRPRRSTATLWKHTYDRDGVAAGSMRLT
jgi:hypothetical protein